MEESSIHVNTNNLAVRIIGVTVVIAGSVQDFLYPAHVIIPRHISVRKFFVLRFGNEEGLELFHARWQPG